MFFIPYFYLTIFVLIVKILLVLGSPNSPEGQLSEMALSRLEACCQLYSLEKAPIVLTGGFGAHFNTSDQPHAYYLRQYLLAHGIPPEAILGLVESANTVQDSTLSKWILDQYKPQEVVVITSDYHVPRAQVVFEAVYAPFRNLTYVGTSSANVDPAILLPLQQHEVRALQDLKDNGVRF